MGAVEQPVAEHAAGVDVVKDPQRGLARIVREDELLLGLDPVGMSPGARIFAALRRARIAVAPCRPRGSSAVASRRSRAGATWGRAGALGAGPEALGARAEAPRTGAPGAARVAPARPKTPAGRGTRFTASGAAIGPRAGPWIAPVRVAGAAGAPRVSGPAVAVASVGFAATVGFAAPGLDWPAAARTLPLLLRFLAIGPLAGRGARARTGFAGSAPGTLLGSFVVHVMASSFQFMRAPRETRVPRAQSIASITAPPSGLTRLSSSEPRPQATTTTRPATSSAVP